VDWWKLREAALYAVGCVSGEITQLAASGGLGLMPLDVAGLMESILREDLVPSAPPFLIGRALWVTARCELQSWNWSCTCNACACACACVWALVGFAEG
jgi:hypothetical protein